MLHERLLSLSCRHLRQFQSRHLFMPTALELLNDPTQPGTSIAQCGNYKWNVEWGESTSLLYAFIADTSSVPLGMLFPDLHGSGHIAFELALGCSAQQCINRIRLLLRFVSVAQRSKQLITRQYPTLPTTIQMDPVFSKLLIRAWCPG